MEPTATQATDADAPNEHAPSKRLLPKENQAVLRLYGQGLGDCFLLAFARAGQPKNPSYVVIDCGVAKGTPGANGENGESARMNQIVQNIHDATDGHIDVVAVTHEHYDHVIGFYHAREKWKNITVDAVWVPWTENPNDAEAKLLTEQKNAFTQGLAQTLSRAMKQEMRFGIDPEALDTLHAEASFLGIDDTALDAQDLGVGAGGANGGHINGYTIALGLKKDVEGNAAPTYCEPGDVLTLPETDVKAYVLGPPRFVGPDGTPIAKNKTPLVKLLVDEEEMYHYRDFNITTGAALDGGRAAAPLAFEGSQGQNALMQGMIGAASDAGQDLSGAFQRYCPFDASLQMDWDEALREPFFWNHYTSGPDWRRVDGDWLSGASDLALRAGSFVNNISLVLAFELPETSKVLLFVGDAQIGNWLSWDFIKNWKNTETGKIEKADIKGLLGRVAFYKVGHHGSHNATAKKGLERMAKDAVGKQTELIAYIPVSVPVAHDILGYCPMPFYPVLRALQEKTGGRVFMANGELLQPLPEGANVTDLWKGVAKSEETLEAKGEPSKRIEPEVPLFIDVSIEGG